MCQAWGRAAPLGRHPEKARDLQDTANSHRRPPLGRRTARTGRTHILGRISSSAGGAWTATRDTLVQARDEAREAKRRFVPPAIMPPSEVQPSRAANAAQDATRDHGWSAAQNCMAESSRAVNPQDTNYCYPDELKQQAQILCCIFGNPFSPATVDPAWSL
jgi:hypothetical protein